MSSPVPTGSLMGSLPTPQGDAFPMTRAEAERKVRKEMASLLADAERQARDIIKAAEKVAMDRAKVLEKAKATLAANRAKKAAEAAAVGSSEPAAGAGPEEAPSAFYVDDSCPWD